LSEATLISFIGSVIGAKYSPSRKLGQYKLALVVYFLLGMELVS
jgi:hypothetical protein